jgi:assimilatory nitrate reductase catalytic subunit
MERTHCPYCAFQCAMHLTANGVEGDQTFPVNRGEMCIKGFQSHRLLQRADRVVAPQMRQLDGSFSSVSWETALDFTASRIEQIQRAHGRESIGVFGSGALTNEKVYALGKFARVTLRTPNIDYNGRYCMSSAAAAMNKSFGLDRGLPFPVSDIGESDLVIVWGSNCAETMPPIMQYLPRAEVAWSLSMFERRQPRKRPIRLSVCNLDRTSRSQTGFFLC